MTRSPRAAAHRVAMVLPRLDLGGMEHTVLAQATALRAHAVDAQLVVLRDGGPLAEEAEARGIPVHAGHDLADARDATAFLTRIGRMQQWTHVHSHTGTWWVAARAAARLRIPHLHTRHGFVEAHDWRAVITEWLAARRTDTVICVSDALRDHTQRRLRVRADRCELIRNGIADDAFADVLPDPIPTEPPTLAMVCRLAPVKNVPLAVRAFAALRERWPALRLHIVGDGPERDRLAAIARTLGVDAAIHLHGASSAPWHHVPAGAIVIQSSDSEGLSLSLIEAMARGHRVVATAVGETQAFCTGAEGVRTVPAGDESAMVDAVSAFLHDGADTVRRYALANRAHARQHGSLDSVIDALVSCYTRTVPH